MSVLPFGRCRCKAAPPHPELPADGRELLAWFAAWAERRGIACEPGHGSLWVRLPGGEVRIDATELLWPVMRPAAGPSESDAAFLAR